MAMGWASVVMADDAEERAVVTASMNAIGQAIVAGTQVVQWPATGAPRFGNGFKGAMGTALLQLAVIFAIRWLGEREAKATVAVVSDEESKEG